MPFDPVSRFHLGNGALIHGVHANADTSEKGIAQSYGAMVNYLYDVPRIAANHERFATDKVIAAVPKVGSIADKAITETAKAEGMSQAITKTES